VDVLDHKLKLRLFRPEGRVILGRFTPLTVSRRIAHLSKEVRLYGTVTYQRDEPIAIEAISVDPLTRK